MSDAPRSKTPPESARLGAWVRSYASDLDDLARQSLSDANYRTLDDLERLAGHPDIGRDGRITLDQVRFHIRSLARPKEAEKRIGDLVAAGFVIREGDAIVLKDWRVRQYKSDATSTERSQEHRARRGQERDPETADATLHATADATLQNELQQRPSNGPFAVPATANATPLQSNRDTDTLDASASNDAPASTGPPAKHVFRDAKHELWAEGPRLMAELDGVSEGKARGLIGGWMRDTGDDAEGVLDAIRRARDAKPINPIPWIVRALPSAPNWRNSHVVDEDHSVHASVRKLEAHVANRASNGDDILEEPPKRLLPPPRRG